MEIHISKAEKLEGQVHVPGDKSISHRAVMLGSIAQGKTHVKGFLSSKDCLSTVNCFRKMGVTIEETAPAELLIYGEGLNSLKEPDNVLDAGNSGTTIRLMLGILAGQDFFSVVTGDASLRNRPMDRVIIPLSRMGAKIYGRGKNTLAPVSVTGTRELKSIAYASPVPSAQVKSAVLLAGLFTEGRTWVTEPAKSRDHTENMLKWFGADVQRSADGLTVGVQGRSLFQGTDIEIPGDISSAAFFMVAGSLVPGSEIVIVNVGISSTRMGIIHALRNMGADIILLNKRMDSGEPAADILVRTAPLKGVEISGEIIPSLIDEIPILAVAATQAEGTTIIKDAGELRFKETDRLKAVASELGRMGAHVMETSDGLIIEGPVSLKGCLCHSYGDHRIAMALAVAGLVAEGETIIKESESVSISFPGFMEKLHELLT